MFRFGHLKYLSIECHLVAVKHIITFIDFHIILTVEDLHGFDEKLITESLILAITIQIFGSFEKNKKGRFSENSSKFL